MARLQSQAPEQTKQAYNGRGKLASLLCTNVSASTRYLFAYDGTSAAGTLVLGPIPIPADGIVSIDNDGADSNDEVTFETGLFLASSSASWPYAASGTADFVFNVYAKARR